MINTVIDVEQIIQIIDDGIKPFYLNRLQEIILKESWQGKTYAEIAKIYNYESDYIKTSGCELWKIISQSFKQQVNKSNFIPFVRRSIIAPYQSRNIDKFYPSSTENSSPIINKNSWTTAPDISHLLENDDDIKPLVEWSKDHRCRCIFISGMIGSGKTTLATKFAYKQQQEFDYVVWLSVQNAPPIQTLLKICLQAFDSPLISHSYHESISLEALLVELVSYLRNYKCLLILDGLQEILECTDSGIYYHQDHDQYGQLIRSIITTNNQALLVMTSRVKLKALNYYGQDQVRFLTLGTSSKINLDSILLYNLNNRYLQQQWSDICQYYLYNPQLLKIVAGNLKKLPEIDASESIINLLTLEEIDNLLNLELKYLSRLEREIIHWLAIDCTTKTVTTLRLKIGQPTSKIKLIEALDNLRQRSFVSEKNQVYDLAPLVKNHLQRKIIRWSLNMDSAARN